MSKLYELKEISDGKVFYWTLEQILKEINRDRSEGWEEYNLTDWEEGWNEWCEGEFYTLVR